MNGFGFGAMDSSSVWFALLFFIVDGHEVYDVLLYFSFLGDGVDYGFEGARCISLLLVLYCLVLTSIFQSIFRTGIVLRV